MEMLSISQAMKAISNEKCCKCGNQAKGLIYRNQVISYYCKKCLKKHAIQSDFNMKEIFGKSVA